MPKRLDIHRVLVIGSGPIVIGQACEFDYSGTQAVKALREEGLEVVLVNSNPATIMTDPELADRTYVEPLTVDALEQIIAREKPDALLPTVGGQTALNLAIALDEAGVLAKHRRATDRCVGAGHQGRRRSARVSRRDARDWPRRSRQRRCQVARRRLAIVEDVGFPAIIRPSFTMGGVGGGIAYNLEEFKDIAGRGLGLSPIHEILVEESVIGWKEFELEVMRDGADNFVVICSIENIDPMGVHTGDSITVAPAQTLDRQGISADARCRAADHSPRRRRDRRLQHPVCDQPRRRPHGRHRNEPARVPLIRARVEGDRVFRSRRLPPSSRSATGSTKFPTTSRV